MSRVAQPSRATSAVQRCGCTGALWRHSPNTAASPTIWAARRRELSNWDTRSTVCTASRWVLEGRSPRVGVRAGCSARATSASIGSLAGSRRCQSVDMVERSFGRRAWRSVAARLRRLRALPLLSPVALRERWHERAGGHPVAAERRPHLVAALEWLLRAQDAAATGGFARGYSLTWHPNFRTRGWQPAYPETTGYIIPTLYLAAEVLGRPELASRAERAARWEIDVQLPSGAVRGGVIGEPESPAVFNTGQVMLDWLSAFAETEDEGFADAA